LIVVAISLSPGMPTLISPIAIVPPLTALASAESMVIVALMSAAIAVPVRMAVRVSVRTSVIVSGVVSGAVTVVVTV
jgi:hypothetical protein